MSAAYFSGIREPLSRRDAIVAILLGVAGVPVQAFGQQVQRVAVIGRLASNAAANASVEESLRKGLRDLKYVEGRDFIIEHRTARGHVDRLPSLAEELVRLKVDVIVTATDETTLAARHATNTIPIVTILYNSPMSIGLVESLNGVDPVLWTRNP